MPGAARHKLSDDALKCSMPNRWNELDIGGPHVLARTLGIATAVPLLIAGNP